MSGSPVEPLSGPVVEDDVAFDLDALSGYCAVERRHIVELLDEGVLESCSVTELRFDGRALRRARIAVRLQRDLGINAAGAGVVLELLERIDELERRLGARR